MINNEFLYRFAQRSRPPEEDYNWDRFLVKFTAKNPSLDSFRNAYFLLENGIGDQVCVLGLLKSFRLQFKAKNIIVLARERSRDLLSLYSNDTFDHVIYFATLPNFATSSGGKVFNVLHRPSKSYSNYGRLGPVFNTFCIPYVDQYRIGLGLPLNSKFTPPVLPTTFKEPSLKNFDVANSVILFPYSNTWDSPPIHFWEKLASILIENGFTVFTNTTNKVASSKSRQDNSKFKAHSPISGTLPLKCSIPELLYIANKCHSIVMNVSGPAWLLANSNCKKVILHPDTNFDTLKFRATGKKEKLFVYEIENLSSNFPEVNFTEIVMSYSEKNSYNKVCNEVIESING